MRSGRGTGILDPISYPDDPDSLTLFPADYSTEEMYRESGSGSFPRETDALLTNVGTEASYGGDDSAYYFQPDISPLRPIGKPHPCAVCCSVFSFIGTIFLTIFGAYAYTGQNYFPHLWAPNQKNGVAKSAWGAAAMYFVCLLVALYYWHKGRNTIPYTSGVGAKKASWRNLDD